MILEICGGGFVHIVCAPCQLESKKQNQYPIKEFLLVHSNRLPYAILTIMKKLPPKHLVFQCGVFVAPISIFLSTVTLVTRYASCQLKSEQQNQYPKKKFLFVHSNHLDFLSLILRFLRVKVEQDSMEESWELVRRGN